MRGTLSLAVDDPWADAAKSRLCHRHGPWRESCDGGLAGRHYEVMVLCHTLTEPEISLLQDYLHEHAPCIQILNLQDLENNLLYSPLDFIRTVELQTRCA